MSKRIKAKTPKNHSFAEMKQIIENSNNLLIISHILPDGDNIGSVIGLTQSLKAAGKQAVGIINGDLPEYYRFLAGTKELRTPEAADFDAADLLIFLDAADHGRAGTKAASYINKTKTINIDHHISNDYFADYNYVDSKAGATAEIVTNFLIENEYPMDASIAAALYVGILTDTGSFTFSNTRAATMAAAAKLLAYPIDLPAMRENIYGNISLRRKRLLGEILLHIETDLNGDLIWSGIGPERCRELEVDGADFEGIIDHLIAVAGVKMAVLFREMEKGDVKVGFRSKLGYDSVAISAPFGGGGHPAAAGCNIEGNLEHAKTLVLEAVRHYLEGKR